MFFDIILLISGFLRIDKEVNLSNQYNCKHLTTTQRIKIEKGLIDGESFAAIARTIDKHPSTVAKEVKSIVIFQNVIFLLTKNYNVHP